jgi:hypothetical protein
MPPLASSVPDSAGASLLWNWINSIPGCPIVGVTLPARIEAENYDRYFDTSAGNAGADAACQSGTDVDLQITTDTGGGCNVGWTSAGEWLEYDVNSPTARNYTLNVRMAAYDAGKLVRVYVDNIDYGTLSPPGSQNWQGFGDQIMGGINLSQGNHIIRLYFQTAEVNVNWLELY